jgi:hypothetical protein
MLFFETTNETKVYYLVLWQKLILYMIKSETVGCDFRADDNSSTGTFTMGKSVTWTGACANEIIPNR